LPRSTMRSRTRPCSSRATAWSATASSASSSSPRS
jgi:hypothetical protein